MRFLRYRSAFFFRKRACETILRYHLAYFFPRAGMQDDLTLPLGLFFPPSGYARRSHVTAWPLFSPERVCETISRYRLAYFFSRAGTRDDLTLPLGLFFLPSGHARRSHITAWPIFFRKRACETILRYHLAYFFPRAGMRDDLTLPLGLFFSASGHARRSCVTTWPIFSPERVCETISRYRSQLFFSRAGMQDDLTLPIGLIFHASGHARTSGLTFKQDHPRITKAYYTAPSKHKKKAG